jgi:hypothetical protein
MRERHANLDLSSQVEERVLSSLRQLGIDREAELAQMKSE